MLKKTIYIIPSRSEEEKLNSANMFSEHLVIIWRFFIIPDEKEIACAQLGDTIAQK